MPHDVKDINVLLSVATEGNAFKPHTIAVDTCLAYNVLRKADFSPGLDPT